MAFDNENGEAIHSKNIDGSELKEFIGGKPIHYEEMFLTNTKPHRMVAWAVSKSKGWADRIERIL